MLKQALLCSSLIAVSACIVGDDPPQTNNPECQIQSDAEKVPGYPFDLASYAAEVLPVLKADCSAGGCHGAPGGAGGFTVWANAAEGNCDYAKTFNSLAPTIDLANPENSPLLIAVRGDLPGHPMQYAPGDSQLTTLTGFVTDASARYLADGGGGDPSPPGASAFDYAVFQAVVQPMLDNAGGNGCTTAGCHSDGAGGLRLTRAPAENSLEMEQNFLAITQRTNLTTPESSLVLLKATTLHAGGGSVSIDASQSAALLTWIQTASDVGGGENPACAPLDRFNLNVFRDEIMPILRGDVDLNNPGGGATTTGCTRGPCHGQDRGAAVLRLSDELDASKNLQNFSCFVNLLSPSASEVLMCPLGDPRCRTYPHPGQNVFGGADDLNYQRVLAFLLGSGLEATPLDFAFFVRRINPIFNDLDSVEGGAQGRTCADATSCHGVGVVGQAAPNGSNFPILPNAIDKGRLSYNFASAASFANFLSPEESSLFLYPTNEIANVADHPLATGLPHPGGADFAVDSDQARAILRWAGGLRPDGAGFVRDWLVAGDYSASLITDQTVVDESNVTPGIFDSSGANQFNNGEWDGLFSNNALIDLNQSFPRAATAGRVAYAVVYLVNTTAVDILAQLNVTSANAFRVYVDNQLVAQGDGVTTSAIAYVPSYSSSNQSTRVLIKLLQRAGDPDFAFSMQLQDELGNALTDATGEMLLLLGPKGGI